MSEHAQALYDNSALKPEGGKLMSYLLLVATSIYYLCYVLEKGNF